jgi:hypothetical protein
MKRVRITGLGGLAVLVLIALTPASAAATLPEVIGASEGPLASKGLTLLTTGGQKMKCTASEGSGAGVEEPKHVDLFLNFTGCTLAKAPCKSGVAPPGDVGFTLRGTLGYINEAMKQVGADFEGSAPPEIAEFECGGVSVTVSGSVIGRVTPINKLTTTVKVKLIQHGGVQMPKSLEGGLPDFPFTVIGGGPTVESGIGLKVKIMLGGPVTVAA